MLYYNISFLIKNINLYKINKLNIIFNECLEL